MSWAVSMGWDARSRVAQVRLLRKATPVPSDSEDDSLWARAAYVTFLIHSNPSAHSQIPYVEVLQTVLQASGYDSILPPPLLTLPNYVKLPNAHQNRNVPVSWWMLRSKFQLEIRIPVSSRRIRLCVLPSLASLQRISGYLTIRIITSKIHSSSRATSYTRIAVMNN